jgi:hypothetical protein
MDDEYTRRAFLSAQPIRDAFEAGTDETEQNERPNTEEAADGGRAVVSGDGERSSRGDGRALRPVLWAIATVVLVLSLGQVVAASGGHAGQPAIDGAVAVEGAPQQQCSPPTDARRTAHDRLEALEAVDGDEAVSIPDESLQAVDRQVEDGDTSYALHEYCDAREAYRAAIEQATPALRDAYRAGAEQHLAAAMAMVEAERADGNPDPDAGALATEIDRQRRALEEAQGHRRLEERYHEAAELREKTRKRLPTRVHEYVAEAVLERPIIGGYAALLTLVVAVQAYRTDSEDGLTIPDDSR